jgi:hypothetical protein
VVIGVRDELVALEFVAAVELEPAVKIFNSMSYAYKNHT